MSQLSMVTFVVRCQYFCKFIRIISHPQILFRRVYGFINKYCEPVQLIH